MISFFSKAISNQNQAPVGECLDVFLLCHCALFTHSHMLSVAAFSAQGYDGFKAYAANTGSEMRILLTEDSDTNDSWPTSISHLYLHSKYHKKL